MTSPWYDLPNAASQGRLEARLPEPSPAYAPVPAGETRLGLDEDRDGLLIVPPGYDPAAPAPLLLYFHGAGSSGERSVRHIREAAAAAGVLILAPDSRLTSWDVLRGGYGPDVRFIDRALTVVFGRFAVDERRLAVGGFSDGASYALSLGLANGDLFTHILAFSPGFMSPPGQEGSPRVYMSHGTQDQVLPIDMCSRMLAPTLARAGYDVAYREFIGPHTVPPEIAAEALTWLAGRAALRREG